MSNTQFDHKTLLRKHRRSLHMIPELGRDLPETKEYLLSVLETLDCTLTFMCGSGIGAYFDRGKKETCAFRSDMDGLPMQEINEVDYRSTHDGRMHACGHDGHMSMALTLCQYVDTVKEMDCNVLVVFQPAEETVGGAEEICRTGIFSRYNVTRIFGIHMWPFTEPGVIASRPGALMPKSAEINIYFHGKTSHGTSPYDGNDALYIAADYIRRVYFRHAQIPGAVPRFAEGIGDIPKAPESVPEQKTLIHIGKMTSGYARNIVADHTHLLGTVRAYSEENFNMITGLLRSELRKIEEDYGCRTEYMNSDGYPPVINDRALYDSIRPVLGSLSGGYLEFEEPLMISEDFSFYGHYVPAVFFTLGTGTGIALHSVNFDFDESVLASGFELYTKILGI